MNRSLNETKLANLDLNLLLSLDILLQECSVSRAAARLGLSQPSLSAALARLRRHFGDELLIRSGNKYELTPFAHELAAKATSAVASVARVFTSEGEFDPVHSDREFSVLISDYAITVLGPALTELLLDRSPGIRLKLPFLTTPAVDAATDMLRTTDALVLPHGFLTDLPSQELFTDRWVCLVSATNTTVGDRLTVADLEQLPMVMTHHAPTAYTPAAKVMSMLGVRPKVRLVAETFLALPFLVAAADGVALIQERLARRLAPASGTRILDCPFPTVPLVEALWWHPMYQRDLGHLWLRGLFAEAARRLDDVG